MSCAVTNPHTTKTTPTCNAIRTTALFCLLSITFSSCKFFIGSSSEISGLLTRLTILVSTCRVTRPVATLYRRKEPGALEQNQHHHLRTQGNCRRQLHVDDQAYPVVHLVKLRGSFFTE